MFWRGRRGASAAGRTVVGRQLFSARAEIDCATNLTGTDSAAADSAETGSAGTDSAGTDSSATGGAETDSASTGFTATDSAETERARTGPAETERTGTVCAGTAPAGDDRAWNARQDSGSANAGGVREMRSFASGKRAVLLPLRRSGSR